MAEISRVLCAVDIDDPGRTAFTQALASARARDARLLLVCPAPVGQPFSLRAVDRVAYLLSIRRQAEAAGVDVFTSVQTGEPAEIILLHARARRADLIVISVEHGRSGGMLWGAIAEEVLRASTCPTLVVPAGASTPSSFARPVYAVDVETDDLAPGDALRLSNPADSTLAVVHVAASRRAAGPALDKLQSVLTGDDDARVTGRVLVGAVAREVLQAMQLADADLLVMNARRRSRVGRRLFGITRQLLERTPCPVLALPPESRRRITTGEQEKAA